MYILKKEGPVWLTDISSCHRREGPTVPLPDESDSLLPTYHNSKNAIRSIHSVTKVGGLVMKWPETQAENTILSLTKRIRKLTNRNTLKQLRPKAI
jgi:hypothetical protein